LRPRHDRDAGGPGLRAQALLYPVCDAGQDTETYRRFAEGPMLTGDAMRLFFAAYGGSPDDPDVSPLRAGDLHGLPPAYVLTASHDVLRAEGEAYARRLDEAGVPVTLRNWEGMVHGFVRWPAKVDAARAALVETGGFLREALG